MARIILDVAGIGVQYIPMEKELVLEVTATPVDIEEGLHIVNQALRDNGQSTIFANEFCDRATSLLEQMLVIDILRRRIKL